MTFPDSPTPSRNDHTASFVKIGGFASTHHGEPVTVVEMLPGSRCVVCHENVERENISIFRLTPEPSPAEIEEAKKRLAEEAEARRSIDRANYEKGEPGIRVVDVRTMGEAAASMVD